MTSKLSLQKTPEKVFQFNQSWAMECNRNSKNPNSRLGIKKKENLILAATRFKPPDPRFNILDCLTIFDPQV